MATQKAAINQYVRHGTNRGRHKLDEQLIIEIAPVIRRMVIHIKNQIYSDLTADDLSSIAIVAVIDAATRIDMSDREEARHYLLKRGRGAVYDELRKHDTMTRSSREFHRDYSDTRDRLLVLLDREPTIEEIADELNMSAKSLIEEVRKTQTANFYSLESWFSHNNDEETSDELIEGESDDAGTNMSDLDMQQVIIAGMDRLKFKERLMLSLYYYDGLNFKEIAKVLRISVGRVSQIHSAAIARLKTIVRDGLPTD